MKNLEILFIVILSEAKNPEMALRMDSSFRFAPLPMTLCLHQEVSFFMQPP